MTERRNKTQKHGMLFAGYIQQHNQAAPLSWIWYILRFSAPQIDKQDGGGGGGEGKKKTAVSTSNKLLIVARIHIL